MFSYIVTKFILILTVVCFIINIIIDLGWDGKIERFDTPMLLLLASLGFGFIYWKMIYNPQNYVK